MKIAVTGATGFIGRYVVDALCDQHEVVAIGRSPESVVQHFSWFSKVTYIQKDINKPDENYYHAFQKPDCVIHLAWSGLPNYKNLTHYEEGLWNHSRLIKNLVENGLKQLVCAGTCFEYGLLDGALSEDMATKPCTVYGLAKDTLRKYIEQLATQFEFDYRWLRLFYPYGDGQSEKSLLSQLQAAIQKKETVFNMSYGDQERDFLPVKEMASYIVSCSVQNEVNGIINICSGQPIAVKDFIQNRLVEMKQSINLNLGYYPYPDYEPMSFWGDRKKLDHVLSL